MSKMRNNNPPADSKAALKKCPKSQLPGIQNAINTKGQGHNLETNRQPNPPDLTGLLMRLDVKAATNPIKTGTNPPPTKSASRDKPPNNSAPYTRQANAAAHTTNNNPTITAAMPVINRFGINDIAGKHACQTISGWQGGPMALNISPPVAWSPSEISKMPCWMAIRPA